MEKLFTLILLTGENVSFHIQTHSQATISDATKSK
jgi:hypothetical protein